MAEEVNAFREDVARYYDLAPHHPDDVPFYEGRVPFPGASVLELGAGTGRVSLPLSARCGFLLGVDHSDAMLDLARGKAAQAGIGPERLAFQAADITAVDLDRSFDLIIAPFRVIQNLGEPGQFEAMLDVVRRHLSPEGRCILNAFRPNRNREGMLTSWPSDEEVLAWTVDVPGGTVTCSDRRARITPDPLVAHPELIYRRYEGDRLVDEAVLNIQMRCFYPEEFTALIERGGFSVSGRWGGYAGEVYGDGPELVVEFGHAAGTTG